MCEITDDLRDNSAMTKDDDDDDKEEVREEDGREAHINLYFMRITHVEIVAKEIGGDIESAKLG